MRNALSFSRVRRVDFIKDDSEHGLQNSDVVVSAGRGIKKSENVALVASLAEGDLPYSTGQVIMVDGGMTLGRL